MPPFKIIYIAKYFKVNVILSSRQLQKYLNFRQIFIVPTTIIICPRLLTPNNTEIR